MPRTFACLRVLAALALCAGPLTAQEREAKRPAAADSIPHMMHIDFGLGMIRPADYVLRHRSELALSPAQVKRLEWLSKALAESMTVRETRLMKAQGARQGAQVAEYQALLGGWTDSIDEARLRRQACESAAAAMEPLIGLARDRRVVGAVLTADQISRLSKVDQAGERGMFQRIEESDRDRPGAKRAANQPYFEFQVEQQATLDPATPAPAFPAALRGVVAGGEVLVQFVVDTAGHPEPESFRVLKSSHTLFTSAVMNALPGMRFMPANVGGRPVRQLVQMPFEFKAPPER